MFGDRGEPEIQLACVMRARCLSFSGAKMYIGAMVQWGLDKEGILVV